MLLADPDMQKSSNSDCILSREEWHDIQDEVRRMRSEIIIGSNITLYDVLVTEDTICSNSHDMANCITNNLYQSPDRLVGIFLRFVGYIKHKITEASEYLDCINPVKVPTVKERSVADWSIIGDAVCVALGIIAACVLVNNRAQDATHHRCYNIWT